MNLTDRYRYVADITNLDGEPIDQLPVTPDWDAAVQWAYFQAVRRGKVSPLMRAPSASVKPLWHRDFGEPRVCGFQVILEDAGGAPPDSPRPGDTALDFAIPRTYLGAEVERCTSRLINEGKLYDGQRFLYQLSAFKRDGGNAREPDARVRRFRVEEVPQPLPLSTASLAAHIENSVSQESPLEPVRYALASGADMPVFIPERVIVEARTRARDAADIETGGVLIGRLYRDSDSTEVFSVITAFIPASETIADRSSLTFTANTWAAVGAAVDLRGENEMLLGWIHSHPFWCRSCPQERRSLCPLMQPFFSRDDIALHRSVFPAAFNIAVLLSDLGESELRCDVFGWRFGMVMSRGYYLTGQGTPAGDLPPAGRRPALPAGLTESARTGDAIVDGLDTDNASADALGRDPRPSCRKKVP
jgi:hypothetical protein